ncbi:MAG: T9SS type A sorting domain-containing protein [Calditrichaeota bacterium]|nr:T9SS type A sorting domain-containing protein [Calditrichota bacterium]
MRKLILFALLTFFLSFMALSTIQTFAQATYVGPEKCLQCHNNPGLGDKTGWRTSMHANGYSYVPDDSHSMEQFKGIVADYDENGIDDFKDGLDFNAISSVFDPYKPNAPILSYDGQNGYQITIGQVTNRVYLTYGGSGLYKQRYLVKINTSQGESAGYYTSPIQFNETTHEYVLYHPEAWWDASNQPVFTPTSTLADAANDTHNLAEGCAGCHVTGLEVEQDANGEWVAHGAGVLDEAAYANYNNIFDLDGDGDLDQVNTTCERCHGPGSEHASTGDKTKITNPADLTADQENNLCGMCHSRGHSLPNGTFSYPFDDTNLTSWTVGDMVADYFSDGGGYWGDGINSKKHHQQFLDFYKSVKPTFQYHQVRCSECHDVHNTEKHHIRTEIVEEDSTGAELAIATDNDNNTLCLACHATHGDFAGIPKEWVADAATHKDDIAAVVSKHSRHTYDPDGIGASRCSKCHNPKVAKSAVAYDIHSHTFEAISPAKTLTYQMPNACAVSCHRGYENGSNPMFNTGVDNSLTNWAEQTDVDLANELLYWYDNMWFRQLGGTGAEVDAVQATTVPAVDGDTTDAVWAGSDWAEIPLANGKALFMKAAYTSSDFYILAKWADSTMSMTRGGSWSYNGSDWVKSSGQSEDRIALLWNISVPEKEFESQGCMTKCHRDVDNKNPGNAPGSEDDVYLPAGQKADMWHMKAARSLGVLGGSQDGVLTVDSQTHEVVAGSVTLNGYCDDKYVGEFSAANAPDGGRYGDSGTSAYSHNRNSDKTAPLYIEKNPADYVDAMVLTQAEIDAGEVDTVANVDATTLAADWAKYEALAAVVPERVLRQPDGSRADVRESATWVNGWWYAEFQRKLNTGNDDDAQFSASGSYKFGVAVMDNAGGEIHWTSGSVLSTLKLGATGIAADKETSVPSNYALYQNYPNPFNPSTTIRFALKKSGLVNLAVYNMIGQQVATVVKQRYEAGEHTVNFDASSLPSGIYLYKMAVNGFTETRKMLLMK